MNPKFSVQQGIVHVNSITVLTYTKDVLHFRIDFQHKYPEYMGYSDDGSFVFHASDRTEHCNPDAPSTDITVRCLPRSWRLKFKNSNVKVFVNTGRYTADVCLIPKPKKIPTIEQWVDE